MPSQTSELGRLDFLQLRIPTELLSDLFQLTDIPDADFEFLVEKGIRYLDILLTDTESGRRVVTFDHRTHEFETPTLKFIKANQIRGLYKSQRTISVPLEKNEHTTKTLALMRCRLDAHSNGEVIACAILAVKWIHNLHLHKCSALISDGPGYQELAWNAPCASGEIPSTN